jgi:salicylate hydroxylase
VRVAIIGAGIGGLASCIALRRIGIEAHVFEQASRFQRVGGGINLTPNSVRCLDGLGIGAAVRSDAYRPQQRLSRKWDTGEVMLKVDTDALEKQYGIPPLAAHRADLLRALEQAIPPECCHLGKRLRGVEQSASAVRVSFADGHSQLFDAVVGADGIHSTVYEALFTGAAPRFTGIVAYRAVVPMDRLPTSQTSGFTKWWGPSPDNELVTFPMSRGEFFVFASRAEPEWKTESWSAKGDPARLQSAFSHYHEEAREVLAECSEVFAIALYTREPLPSWSSGPVTLLGDACHAMVPFMAQGAAMALEDAVVLSRCLGAAGRDSIADAFVSYQRTRMERTARIQEGSRRNDTWLRDKDNAGWVYGYDAWTTPLLH